MGKSKKLKKPLIDGCLTSNILTEEVKVTDSMITWYVINYSRLHPDIHYIAAFPLNNTILRVWVRRRPFSFYIFFKTDDFVSDMIFLIRGSTGSIVDSKLPVKEGNVYCALFDEQKILTPCGKLINDILTVQFLYNTRPHEKAIHLTPGLKQCNELKTSDVDSLFNDLRDLYFSAKFYDFILKAGNVKFKVHKLILFRHSKYLARKITEDREWTGDYFDMGANPDAMHKVLLYLYSGELTNLDFESIRDVYFIASSLEISSLQDLCIHFYRSIFSVDNVYDLLVSALVHDNIDFQREIILFLNKQPEAVRKKRAWAQAIRDVMQYVPEDMRELSES